MIVNGYCTLAEAKLHLRIASVDAADDSVLEDCIEAASRFIDQQTGRWFYVRTETRTFDLPQVTLYFDADNLSVTGIINGNGVAIPITEVIYLPSNSLPRFGMKLKPYTPYFWQESATTGSYQCISVTGTWGWAATIPDDIHTACLDIGCTMYRQRSGENAMVRAEVTAGGIILAPDSGYSSATLNTLKYYRRL